ncbi:MAG: hypothetical protein RLY58_1695, partial [Pseudomonadota bacterium]
MPPIAPLPFRLSPLVLALCCVFTPPAMAAPDASPADAATMSRDTSVANEVATDADANASNDTDTLAQPWSNAPAGFMSRATLATDSTLKDRPIPAGCQGLWVTPIPASIRPDPHNDNVNILATADYGYYHPSAGSELSGQVRISQPNRLLEADHITLDATQTIAEASGHVRLSEIGLVSLSDRLRYNLKDQSGDMSSSQYISESLQAHGHAQQVSRTPEGVTHLTQAEYSTCEPDHRVWNLKARSI